MPTCYKTDKSERFDSLSSRSLSLRPARLCRSFPSCSILDAAEFTLSERKRVEWARNDKMRDWNGNAYCVHKDLANTTTLIFMREFLIRVIRGKNHELV